MGTAKTNFLGKRGRAFGPFTDADLTRMRASGEIETYTYLWDSTSEKWINLEPAPPSPTSKHLNTSDVKWEAVCVCRSTNLMVSGTIKNIGPEGCDLVGDYASDSPQLGTADSLHLNVLDPSKNVAVNISASVAGVSRLDGSWIYHLHWPSVPEL